MERKTFSETEIVFVEFTLSYFAQHVSTICKEIVPSGTMLG